MKENTNLYLLGLESIDYKRGRQFCDVPPDKITLYITNYVSKNTIIRMIIKLQALVMWKGSLITACCLGTCGGLGSNL